MHAEGAALLERAIAANPNCAEACIRGGWVSVWNGDFDTALYRADMSERLDPLSLEGMNRLNLRAALSFFSRRFDAAIDAAERALGRAPDYNSARRYLVAALIHSGREEEARSQAKELLRRDPGCHAQEDPRQQPVSSRTDDRVLPRGSASGGHTSWLTSPFMPAFRPRPYRRGRRKPGRRPQRRPIALPRSAHAVAARWRCRKQSRTKRTIA